jgi:uncharacterized membrane protein YccC
MGDNIFVDGILGLLMMAPIYGFIFWFLVVKQYSWGAYLAVLTVSTLSIMYFIA